MVVFLPIEIENLIFLTFAAVVQSVAFGSATQHGMSRIERSVRD